MKAISDKQGLCWNCLKEFNNVSVIHINALGYGSSFDGLSTELHLCEDCLAKSNKEIWSMEVISDGEYCEEYKHEQEMLDFLNSLPLVSKQFVFNEFSSGWNSEYMEPQDWIDYELGTLSHSKCKDYGLYSFEEIAAYKERFPICEHPVNRVYSDGSAGCWCPFGAHGDVNQELGLNMSSDCFECPYFKERKDSLKTVEDKDWSDYKIYVYSQVKGKELEEKFKNL